MHRMWQSLVVGAAVLGTAHAAPSFWWGAATSAYQVEGAWNVDGRLPSIWDNFSQTPGKITNNDNGDVGTEFYYRYPEDIALMVANGVQHFRMSVSWPRIFPTGSGQVNPAGVQFYQNLTNALSAAGIQVSVTLYHWDLPQALQDAYGGPTSPLFVDDFVNYTATVASALGSKVQYWSTFNEGQSFCPLGYGEGTFAPGIASRSAQFLCTHYTLLAHAAASAKLREIIPGAQVSMNFNSDWSFPYTDSAADQAAVQRHLDLNLGIWADPIYFGDYPASVKAALGSLLPSFTPEQSAQLVGSATYFGLNHYTSEYIQHCPEANNDDKTCTYTTAQNGTVIGPTSGSPWLIVVPQGFKPLLQYIQQRYNPGAIIVTENGVSVPGESSESVGQALDDSFRIAYLQGYLDQAQAAVASGVNLIGYFCWALMDNFEWTSGYGTRFGIIYVDYTDDLARTPKQSLSWLQSYFS